MGNVIMIGKVKGHPKKSLSKDGTGLCTLDICMPKRWTDAEGKEHTGRDYLYRVRYAGDMAIEASRRTNGERVYVVGQIDKRNYMRNWERERKYWAYIQGSEIRSPQKKTAVIL